jgi:hypothetical protein
MKAFNIKVTEYGIAKGDKVVPPYYTWDYCTEKRIPHIIIRPKIKYSNIDYDLFTVDNGLLFKEGYSIIDHWWKIYEEYVDTASFPKERIPLRIIGTVTDNFTVFKKDQEIMVKRLLTEIEKFVNEYGIIDLKRKKYYDDIYKRNEISRQATKYFETLNKSNKK